MAGRTSSEPDPAQTALAKAQKLIDIGRYDAAIPPLLAVLSARPDDHTALCLLSLAHLQCRRAAESLRFSEQAVTAEPQREWGHRLRALGLRRLSRYKEALEAARRAVECEPEGLFPLHAYCSAQLDAKRAGFARETADRLISLHPSSKLAWESAGLASLANGDDAQAEYRFRAGIALDPLSASLWNNLGVALYRQGNREEAIRCYSESARLNPRDPLAKKNALGAAQGGPALRWSPLLILTGVPGIVALLALRMAVTNDVRKHASPEMQSYIKQQRKARAWDVFRVVLVMIPAIPLLLWSFLWLVDTDDFKPVEPEAWGLFAGLSTWLVIALLVLADCRLRAVGRSAPFDPFRRLFRR